MNDEPMTDVFTLDINMGNEAMETAADVANALAQVVNHLAEAGSATVFGGPIRDVNGNTVGSYQLSSRS